MTTLWAIVREIRYSNDNMTTRSRIKTYKDRVRATLMCNALNNRNILGDWATYYIEPVFRL